MNALEIIIFIISVNAWTCFVAVAFYRLGERHGKRLEELRGNYKELEY